MSISRWNGLALEYGSPADKIEAAAELGQKAYAAIRDPLAEALSMSAADLDAKVAAHHKNGANGKVPAVELRHIGDIVAERREPQWLLHKIIERNVLAVIAGARGTFKKLHRTRLGDAHGSRRSRWRDPIRRRRRPRSSSRRVAQSTSRKRRHCRHPLGRARTSLNLTAVLQMAALCEAIQRLPAPPAFIVIDTLSKFSTGLDENDNGEVAAFLSGLSTHLREDLNCTVLLVAHSGHGDAQRPRGASSLMSNPDAEYIVNRPDPLGMTVTVTRERFKDAPTVPPLAYEAKVIDLGRLDAYGEPVTSLALVMADGAAPISNAKGRGRNQDKILTALKEWHRQHPDSAHITSIDFREICRTQRIDRKREREVLNAFVNARILTPSVGGYALHGENL